jgi:hypothetical protein
MLLCVVVVRRETSVADEVLRVRSQVFQDGFAG